MQPRTPEEGLAVELNDDVKAVLEGNPLCHYRLPTFKTVWTKVRETAFVVDCLHDDRRCEMIQRVSCDTRRFAGYRRLASPLGLNRPDSRGPMRLFGGGSLGPS